MSLSNANILKMNDSETIIFIELYKKERVLWDPTMTDYKCRVKRTTAAQRIAASMKLKHFTHSHVIQKFKNLRSSYLQELKKIVRSAESVSLSDEFYVPKVIWFKLMDSFLKPHVKQRTNLELPYLQKIEPDAYSANAQENKMKQEEHHRICDNLESQEKNARSTLRVSNSNEPGRLTQWSTNYVTSSKEDSFDYFGRFIASALRDIPKRRALQLESEIMTLLIKSQIEIHSRPPSSLSMLSESTN